MTRPGGLATDEGELVDATAATPASEVPSRDPDGAGAARPESAPPPSQVIISPGDPANDDGDPDAEEESPAGDKAVPLDLEAFTPGNDNLDGPARQRHGERLADRKLLARCIVYLQARHGMKGHDAKDVVQDAFVRAYCIKRIPADDGRSLYPWMRRFVNNQRFKFFKKRGTQRRREEQVEDIDTIQATAVAIDQRAVVLADYLERLAKKSRGNALAVAMLRARDEGKTWEEIGKEFGVTPETARQRVHRVITFIRHSAPQLSALAMGLALVLLYLQLRPPPEGNVGGGNLNPDTNPLNAPRLNAPLTPLDGAVTAADMRARGVSLCEEGRYEVCLELLDRAVAKDPAEAKRAEVVRWRGVAEKALHGSGSPGSR